MFPNPAVGGINSPGPIIQAQVADGGGEGFLEGKGGQGRYFGRKVIAGGTLATNGGDGQNKIAQGVFLFETTALAQKQNGFGGNGREQIHHRCGHRRTHPKIHQGDTSGPDTADGFVQTLDGDVEFLCKKFQVMAEIGEQDIRRKIFQSQTRVAGQPIVHNFFLAFHGLFIQNYADALVLDVP